MEKEKIDKQIISYYRKQKLITKSTKDITTSASSKAINRLDPTIVRWGQDGWILDYLTEHIFKGLMRDFHLESKEDGATIGMSPESLFHFYIEGIKNNSLPTPMASIDLKKAKEFLQKPFSERQLFEVVQKIGNQIFKGGITLPKITELDTKEIFEWMLPKDESIFSYTLCKREDMGEKPRGLKTVEHNEYYMLLTFLGIYLIFAASAFYNIEFLPKALYRLNDGCNDFYRSIAGWWYKGFVKLSYNEVRSRMGIREKNPSSERQYIERNLNHLKDKNIIENWERVVKGNRKYIKNQDVIYDITISLKNRKRSRNYAIRKQREKMMKRAAEVHQLEEENENESL